MTAWDWSVQWVAQLYDVLRAQGGFGCGAAVIAAVQLAAWGLQLTDGDRPLPAAGHRRSRLGDAVNGPPGRVLGWLLQVGAALLIAIAMVALVRALAEA